MKCGQKWRDFVIWVFVEELLIKIFLAFVRCESRSIEDPIWWKVNSANSINALYKIPFNVILPQFGGGVSKEQYKFQSSSCNFIHPAAFSFVHPNILLGTSV